MASIAATAGADSELTQGKKALFGEDFELDIYEWAVAEPGRVQTRVSVSVAARARAVRVRSVRMSVESFPQDGLTLDG